MSGMQPEISECSNVINKLSDEELKELVYTDDNDRYDRFISQNERLKALESERDILIASVRSLAEFNLSRQGGYESDRTKLMEVVSASYKVIDSIQQKEAKLRELTKKTCLDSTLSVIMAAAAKAEEDSETIASQFMDKSLDYETFISSYSEKKKLAHCRRIKAERLRQEKHFDLLA